MKTTLKNIAFLFIIVLFFSACGNGGWKEISVGKDPEGGKFILAIDRSDITDLGDKKTAWARKSFSNPKKLKDGNTYLETYIFFAVSCKEKKYSIIELGMTNPDSNEFVHTIKFSNNIDDIVWSDVPENKPSQKIYNELCVWYKPYL